MSYVVDISSGALRSPAVLQWAPTLTVHDPNPPITLETPPPAPAGGQPFYIRDSYSLPDTTSMAQG